MPQLDVPLLCRIALEDSHPGELVLDALSRICQESYGAQGDQIFAQVIQAIEAEMAAGASGPDAAVARLADSEPVAGDPPRRRWWPWGRR